MNSETHKSPGIKRPLTIHLIAAAYVFLPVGNILFRMLQTGIHSPVTVLSHYTPTALMFLVSAPVIGIGIWFIKRWAYYFFLAHAAGLVLLNLFHFLFALDRIFAGGALVRTTLALLLFAYFLRKNISAPYLHVVPRGWRHHLRQEITVGVFLDDQRFLSRDLSRHGCFLNHLDDYEPIPGAKMSIGFSTGDDENQLQCTGEIMHVNDEGFGVRFLGLDRSEKNRIREFLRTRFPVRYRVEAPALLQTRDETIRSTTASISEAGMYLLCPDELPEEGTARVELEMNGETFNILGSVVWRNPEGEFQKQRGVGVSFDSVAEHRQFRSALKKISRAAEVVR